MQRVEGKIIVTFDTRVPVIPERQLEVEQYLNNIVSNLMYANLGVQIRVHLNSSEVEPDPMLGVGNEG